MIAPLGVLAICRIAGFEGSITTILISFLPLLMLPSYAALAVGIFYRKIGLIVMSAALVCCHLIWVYPDFKPAAPISDAAQGAPKVTVYSHNVLFDNPVPEQLWSDIAERDADVVMLQELSINDLKALEKTEAYDKYAFRFTKATTSTDGLAIWSKYPLADTELVTSAGFPQMRATIEVDGKHVVLWCVHTMAPVAGVDDWKADFSTLTKRVEKEDGHVVMAGDFNATMDHAPLRKLIDDASLTDVHTDLGKGSLHTWPVDDGFARRLGGLVRIDHGLVSDNVTPLHGGAANGAGSDHRSIWFQVALMG